MIKIILLIVGIIIIVALFQKGLEAFKEKPIQSSFEASKTIYSTTKSAYQTTKEFIEKNETST